jgi:small subunit ribosomal protein S16
MLCLKLSRIGKRKQPVFRLIIVEKTKDPWGDYLELLGNYNPKTKVANFKKERIEFWLNKGAQMTPTVNNLLINQKIIAGKKAKNIKVSNKRKAKIASAEPAKTSAATEPKTEETKE